MNLNGATLVVLDFWTFNPRRKDVKSQTWFRLDNDIYTGLDFYNFTSDEIGVWVFILSLCSRLNRDRFVVDMAYNTTMSRIGYDSWYSALQKLLDKNMISLPDHCLRNVYVTEAVTCTGGSDPHTYVRTNERTDTLPQLEKEVSPPAHSTGVEVQTLVDLWNENRGQLAKVKELNENRKRLVRKALKERPDLDEWKRIVKFLARDEFYSGRKPGSPWKANFDFLIRSGKHVELFEKVPTPRQPVPDEYHMPTPEEALAKLLAKEGEK